VANAAQAGDFFPGPPKLYDLSKVTGLQGAIIPLQGNRSIQLKSFPGMETKIVFEDKFPRANWGHPASLKVVDMAGRVLDEKIVHSPPKFLSQAAKFPELKIPRPEKTKVSLKTDQRFFVKSPEKHFAVLINGNASQRHWNDFAFLYRTLVEVYGYSKANIFVADSYHQVELPDLDDDGKNDIEWGSTLAGIQGLFRHLGKTLTPDSELLTVVNDHGEIKDGEAVLVVNDGEIRAGDFAKQLGALPPKRAISVYQQCFGGGFVRPSLGDYRVALSAATSEEFSWATADFQFDEFLYHLTSALALQTHEGKPVAADRNRDGKMSIQEAFAYALAEDSTPESPLMESFANSGFARLFGLHF